MNTLTPYEIIIAQKLEQLPVPQMADSIWAGIEQQLDAGSSPDGGSSQTPPARGLPGIGNGFYVFIAVVIGLTLVWKYTGNKNDADNNIIQPKTETPKPVTDSSQLNGMTAEKNIPYVQSVIDKKDSFSNTIKKGNGNKDSITNTALTDSKNDTVAARINNIVKLFFDSTEIAPLVKKPKGVKGIKDSDYKIIIDKNDSLKKGN